MLSEYLQSVDGVEIYGIATLVLSVILFAWIVIRARKADGTYIRRMERLPLDATDGPAHDSEKAHT